MPGVDLLLLTGAPGCGKTTVAPLVADQRTPSTCLDLDWFFAKVRQGGIEPWREAADVQNRVVLAAAAAAVAQFAAGGYCTVAEGIIFPDKLDLFLAAAAPLGVAVHYAVLRAPLDVALRRTEQRTQEPEHIGALADERVISDLWGQFEGSSIADRHWVEAGQDRAPGAVAAAVYERYAAGELRLTSPED